MNELRDIFNQIKAFAFDVDGVLTDGSVLATEKGEHLRVFNVKDGYALSTIVKLGYPVIIISGGISKGVNFRLQFLGIKHIYLGTDNKKKTLLQILKKLKIKPIDVAYMGDDIPDIEVMEMVGLSAAPADASAKVLEKAKFISSLKGGHGAVRELITNVLLAKGIDIL